MANSTDKPDKWTDVFGSLTKVLPAALIHEVLQEFGKTGRKAKKLPPEVVTWLVIAMGVFRDLNISDCLARVVEGLGTRWSRKRRPHTTSISQARDRLGWLPVRELFRRLARRLRDTYAEATKWKGFLVYALDGTTFAAPETPANVHWFGLPPSSGSQSAFPRIRGLFLVGVWSHLVVEAAFGGYRSSELRLAEHLLDRLEKNSLVLLDRLFYGFGWAAFFVQRASPFVMRARQGVSSAHLYKSRSLGENDWLCTMKKPHERSKFGRHWIAPDEIVVRLVVCERKGFRPVLLITNLLDPKAYPAAEIAQLFRDRWEVELSFRELKVHLTQGRRVLRSRKPERVLQELYGLLIAFNLVRSLMCVAAGEVGLRPIKLSFVECLHRVRWTLAARTHDAPIRVFKQLMDALRDCRLPPRRVGRTYVRAIKLQNTSRFPRKRSDRPIALNNAQIHARKRLYVINATDL